MKKRPLHFTNSGSRNCLPQLPELRTTITPEQLKRYAAGWILDCKSRQLSPCTIDLRETILKNFYWFAEENEYAQIGTFELRSFLAYFQSSPEGGRWGNPKLIGPVRPSTVKTYHAHLAVLFKWIVEEGGMDTNPMTTVRAPRVPTDQIVPFTDDQVNALLAAAKTSAHPRRDTAILLMLLDTGFRVSEICNLKRGEVDMLARQCQVLGKGNKYRNGYFGRTVTRALNAYLREERTRGFEEDSPLFLSDRGKLAGQALTRSGMQQLVERLGKQAGIETARCSPHTFRHTFAVNFLRSGGTVFALKEILGHNTLAMTQKYVNFTASDMQVQHRKHSPADRLRGGR